MRGPFENNLNLGACLNGSCTIPSSCEFGKKVCLDAPSDWWTVKPKRKVTKNQWQRLNIHDNWLRMLQDDEPPKSSWRPRTNTVVRPIKRAKIHESHTVTEKGTSRGKLVLPSFVAWRACTKIRDAPAEKSRESKAQISSTRTEMLFLWCFSAPYWENFSSLWSTLHNLKPKYEKTYGISYSYEATVKCKIGYDGGLMTWISAKPTDWTPQVNYHIPWKMAEKSVLCGKIRAPRCSRFLWTRSSCSTSPTSLTSWSQD